MIVTDIQRMLRAAKRQHLRPVIIELGEKQCRAFADYANDVLYPTVPHRDPVTWEHIATSRGTVFAAVRVVGVESPDYLGVVAEAITRE